MPDGDLASRFAASRARLEAKKQAAATVAHEPVETVVNNEHALTAEKPTSRSRKMKPTRGSLNVVIADIQQSMPHSVEMEQGVLGSILVDCQQGSTRTIVEVSSKITPEHFYVPAHKTVYEAMLSLWSSGIPIDLISFTNEMRERRLLDSVGGAAFVTALFTFVPTAANVCYYLDEVHDDYLRREAIAVHTRAVRSLFSDNENDAGYLIDRASFRLSRVKQGRNGAHELSAQKLIEMKDQSDPNTLVGHRWLVRGGNSLWAGGAGYGKSSLIMQTSIYWANGHPVFAIKPLRPLKSLIVQAENDDHDVAEQFNGVLAGIKELGDDDVVNDEEKLAKNLIVTRVDGMSGAVFIAELEFLLSTHRPDIVWIDPLFAFAGCDLMDSQTVGRFLREMLFPLFVKYRCCGNVVHHVGKPARAQNGQSQTTAIDEQYLSFGSSEIQNAFRAINVLKPPTHDAPGVFRLVLSKRGQRAGAKSTSNEFTRDIFIKQSFPHICWQQVAEPTKEGSKSRINVDRVLAQLSTTTPKTAPELEAVLVRGAMRKMSRATLYRSLETIEQEKLASSNNEGWLLKSHQSHLVSGDE